MDWIQIIVSILSGLAVCIPLVFNLIKYVTTSVKEQNWSKLVALIMDAMASAETLFDNGSHRKAWVMSMVPSLAKSINYEPDMDKIGELIDSLCALSKVVNSPRMEGSE